MGGLFSSEQAIIIPLPGDDSTAVKTFVSTTNKVLYNLRKIFCRKSIGDERSVAVTLFEFWLYLLKHAQEDSGPCLNPDYFTKANFEKMWIEAKKHPIYSAAPKDIKQNIKEIFFDVNNAIREIGEALCTGGPPDNKAAKMTKEDASKAIQQLYDALCPEDQYTLKPVNLTEDNLPQLMRSLYTLSITQSSNQKNDRVETKASPTEGDPSTAGPASSPAQ